jgi:hypothetical protein
MRHLTRHLTRTLLVLAVVSASVTASAEEGRQAKAVRFARPFNAAIGGHVGDGPVLNLQGKMHVDHLQYKDLRGATYHLLKTYPADRHYFIGLGRDPAPIIAFLQNLGGKQLAINFPASSNEGSAATPQILATYVQKLVPPEILESGRTIVFVDATSSGRALDHYVPLIAPSLKGLPFLKVAFGVHSGQRNTRIYTNPGDKQVIDTSPFPEVNKFYTDPYEDVVSEYPRHGPGTHPINALDTPRPEYQKYRDALNQRMQRDPELDHFLRHEGGPAFGDP